MSTETVKTVAMHRVIASFPLPEPHSYERHGIPGTRWFHTRAVFTADQMCSYAMQVSESAEARAQQLAAELAEAKKINAALCKIQDDDVSECEYIHNEIERAGCTWIQEGPGTPSKIVNTRAQRAEQALRELVEAESVIRRPTMWPDRLMAAWDIARAIVESK